MELCFHGFGLDQPQLWQTFSMNQLMEDFLAFILCLQKKVFAEKQFESRKISQASKSLSIHSLIPLAGIYLLNTFYVFMCKSSQGRSLECFAR